MRAPVSVFSWALFVGLGLAALPVSAQEGAGAEKPAEGAKEEKKKESWDVNNPPYERFTNTIDTDEGTWMCVDVSPDGEEIVFDLLGDLYVMPIDGGEAKAITSGMAWDMQPRFSPDGKQIAFTSDRSGKDGKAGDNIWVIDRDGSSARQITAESFRLVSGASWSPDGEFIVARKHFTSRRSLGAGEMWLYHRTGVEGGSSAGLQLTEKPTEQKDVNEPIFSPDGKYLYYSEDASPGQNFEYDKDSNGQIYIVNRLELATGEKERYITGPGGACRPTPSPDGKTIAFVRRIHGKTGLHLFDIATGGVTPVYDDLERDMQEAWAIHGVYPTFAWTPDSKSIVFWSRGKIRRYDLMLREARVIPFHVKDSREVSKAVRFAQEAAPETFDVRMLRWVQVSPTGDRAVYTALGRLYGRALPTGEPKRLTSQDKDFELYPSFSRDGRYVTYVTWNDDALGSVRVLDLRSGESWAVTHEPGHYIEPVIAPDNETVVYVKVGGGYLTSPLWSRDRGVYMAPFQSDKKQKPERITKDGRRPQFGSSSDRVYVIRSDSGKDADNLQLASVGLRGADKGEERTHFTSTWATDYTLSPDGKWVGFVERYRVYVAPFVQTGKAVKVGPKENSFPIARASKEAGDFIHFSGDSKRLHWSLGPTLHTRDLTDTFAFLDGAPEKLPDGPTSSVEIGFEASHDKPSGSIALVGARVITMRNAMTGEQEVLEDATVVIEGNRITGVGPRDGTEIPAGAHVVECEGRVVYPGLVDVHAHGAQGTNGIIPGQNWLNFVQLSLGVTTVHDPSNDTETIFSASEMVKAGVARGPRTFSTGTILYGAAGSFKAEIDSLEDATFHLSRMKAVGAFSVKSYNQPRRDQRQQVLAAARELNMLVVPEGGSTFAHNLTMIADGHTGIEHTFPVEIVYKDVLQLWKGTEVGYTPTLDVAYGGLGGENYWYMESDLFAHPRLTAYIPPNILNPRARRRMMAPVEDFNHIREARITKQAIENGITVQAGGHGQLPGINTHWEVWSFVQGGMTNFEALRSGTIHGAFYIGMDKDLGSIEAGKLADLVILAPGKDPIANIRDTEFTEWVVANGRLYDAKSMDELAPSAGERGEFFWEKPGARVTVGEPPEHAGCEACGRPALGSGMVAP